MCLAPGLRTDWLRTRGGRPVAPGWRRTVGRRTAPPSPITSLSQHPAFRPIQPTFSNTRQTHHITPPSYTSRPQYWLDLNNFLSTNVNICQSGGSWLWSTPTQDNHHPSLPPGPAASVVPVTIDGAFPTPGQQTQGSEIQTYSPLYHHQL